MNKNNSINENYNDSNQDMEKKANNNSIFSNSNIVSLLTWSLRAFLFSILILTLTAEVVLCKSCCSNPNIPTASTTATKQPDKNTSNPKTSISELNDSNINQKDYDKDNYIENTKDFKSNETSFVNDIISNLTLAVNSVNNVLTGGSIALGILTLFIGVVGLFGFHSLKNDVNERIKEIRKALIRNEQITHEDINQQKELFDEMMLEQKEEFNKTMLEHTKITNQINKIRESISRHDIALSHYNQVLYDTTYAVAQQIEKTNIAQSLMNTILHDFQIANLYHISLDSDETTDSNEIKFATFAYLEENGTLDDIPHLDYVEQHDPNEFNKRRAIEIKAIINRRFEKS